MSCYSTRKPQLWPNTVPLSYDTTPTPQPAVTQHLTPQQWPNTWPSKTSSWVSCAIEVNRSAVYCSVIVIQVVNCLPNYHCRETNYSTWSTFFVCWHIIVRFVELLLYESFHELLYINIYIDACVDLPDEAMVSLSLLFADFFIYQSFAGRERRWWRSRWAAMPWSATTRTGVSAPLGDTLLYL